VPYVEHVFGVALILDRMGFSESVVIAGLLHDATEDTDATLADIADEFGGEVAELVAFCSETKLDDEGQKRPWIDRKRDHLLALGGAPLEARAVFLADKLHNLLSIVVDLHEGRPIWAHFNADQSQVLWYYHESISQLGVDDSRLVDLAGRCRRLLEDVESIQSKNLEKNRCDDASTS
jgi:(p)ppGpp synthase/HD superfamily hydrolase